MFNRLKRAVVESYVGAIALGYLFAQGMFRFVNIFASPVGGWVSRNEYREVIPSGKALAGFTLKDALPDLVRFVFLLLIWYLLMRWLYFNPLKKEPSEPVPNSEQAG